MDKFYMPLVEGLKEYNKKAPTRFHTPGHKGKVLRPLDTLGENLFPWDLTEIKGLDDFFNPQGIIKMAQDRLSKLYNADNSFFLVNGATSGIIAMMVACLKPGDKILIPRNSHISILSGMIVTGAKPVYINPEFSNDLGVSTQPSFESIERALKENPDIKAILITNPTYQGFCPDLGGIAHIAKKYSRLLLVDEAHGAHFALNTKFPPSAGDFDVDIWVQSPHKMLLSLTQTAWLHIKGELIDAEKILQALSLTTSTSPSYIFMASLDMSRALMEVKGSELWDIAYELSEKTREKINKDTVFYCIGKEVIGKNSIFDLDPCRLMINTSIAGYKGYEIEEILIKEFNIYPEYADFGNVYFLVSFNNTKEDMEKLIKALQSFGNRKSINTIDIENINSQILLTARKAFFSKEKKIPFSKASGYIAKNPVIPYPPGIPLIMPGEKITVDHIKTVRNILDSGGYCRGINQGKISVVLKWRK